MWKTLKSKLPKKERRNIPPSSPTLSSDLTPLYAALLSYVKEKRIYSFKIQYNKDNDPISILIRNGASIESIYASLSKVFTHYWPYYTLPNPNREGRRGCFCPYRHPAIGVMVIEQVLLNKEDLDYTHHEGLKSLVLESICKPKKPPESPARLKQCYENMALSFLHRCGATQTIEAFLLSQPLSLIDEQGDLNQPLFNHFMIIKSPLAVKKIQEQLLSAPNSKAMNRVYELAIYEFHNFMDVLIDETYSELFILFSNHFIKHNNPNFIVDRWDHFVKHCFSYNLNPSVDILVYLESQKKSAVLFSVLRKVNKGSEKSLEIVEKLIIEGLCFSPTESLFDQKKIDKSKEEREALLTYYGNVRNKLRNKMQDQFPEAIKDTPCAGIVLDYLVPNSPHIEIKP